MSEHPSIVELRPFASPQKFVSTAGDPREAKTRFLLVRADEAAAKPAAANPAEKPAAATPPKRPKRETDAREVVRPSRGQLTYDVEGNEGGRWASRYLHVPSGNSGLTIGRGYDMKMKSAERIAGDLKSVGVDAAAADLLAKASGLKGDEAKKFIADHDLEEFSLTPQQQADLFDIVYAAEAAVAKRICLSEEVQKKYGAVDWDKLNPAIQEMLIDLKYRGDYTPRSRAFLQPHVVANDLPAFVKALGDRSLWPDVPPNRFERRKVFIEKAAAEQEKRKKEGDAPPAAKP